MYVNIDYLFMLPAAVIAIVPWIVFWCMEVEESFRLSVCGPSHEERMGSANRCLSPHYGPRRLRLECRPSRLVWLAFWIVDAE